jgi:hypothetical protein
MYRVLVVICLVSTVTVGGLAAHANEIRFPKTGKYAFRISVPTGWQAKTDTRGGLLLVPPGQQHAMIYASILVDNKFSGTSDSAVAADVARIAGIRSFYKQDHARISDPTGAVYYRGKIFYGTMPAKRGLARKAKIAIFRLEPNTWAQVWVVTQAGMNPTETDALDHVLNSITLTTD